MLVELLVLPLVVHGLQRLWLAHTGGVGWATSKGAFAMSLGPTLFAAALLFVTRMFWAAWMAWGIDVLVLGLLATGDLVVDHGVSPRLVVSALALPFIAWRIAGLQRLQRVRPPASEGG